jgi:metal-responsive CopG/Arc/MetJ family transcriptional regulator
LPEELVDLLDEAATHTGIPRQQIIADALAKYLPKLMKSAG